MLDEKVEEVSALLKSISHPLRLRLLCKLQDGAMTVGELQKEVKTTPANVSQHLTKLRNQGIVSSYKEANFIYNRISDDRVLILMNKMQELFC